MYNGWYFSMQCKTNKPDKLTELKETLWLQLHSMMLFYCVMDVQYAGQPIYSTSPKTASKVEWTLGRHPKVSWKVALNLSVLWESLSWQLLTTAGGPTFCTLYKKIEIIRPKSIFVPGCIDVYFCCKVGHSNLEVCGDGTGPLRNSCFWLLHIGFISQSWRLMLGV